MSILHQKRGLSPITLVVLNCGTMSITRTSRLCRVARQSATLTAIVVFATPPFMLTKLIDFTFFLLACTDQHLQTLKAGLSGESDRELTMQPMAMQLPFVNTKCQSIPE